MKVVVTASLLALLPCSVFSCSGFSPGVKQGDAPAPDAGGEWTDGGIELSDADLSKDSSDSFGGDAKTDSGTVAVQPAPASAAMFAMGEELGLAVWVDLRNHDHDIYASRISQSGEILDPGGIAISIQAGNERHPTVAWADGYFQVAWMDRRFGGTGIYTARVGVDGSLLDPDGVEVSSGQDFSQFPSLACSGQNCLIAYEGPCGNNCTGAIWSLIDSEGSVSPGSLLSETGRKPVLAFNGQSYVAAYIDYRDGGADLYAKFVNPGGIPSFDEFSICTAASNQLSPAIAASKMENGGNFLIAWVDMRQGLSQRWRTMSSNGVLGEERILDRPVRWQDEPTLSFDGSHFIALWTEVAGEGAMVESHLGKVGSDGLMLEPAITILSAPHGLGDDEKNPKVSCFDGACAGAWQQEGEESSRVLGMQMQTNAQPIVWATMLEE